MPDFLHTGPHDAPCRLLLAHGAGAAMSSPFMNNIAALLAQRGVAVSRFEFSYMAARRNGGKRRPPPRAETLKAEYEKALAAMRSQMRRGAGPVYRRQVVGRARRQHDRRGSAWGRLDRGTGMPGLSVPSFGQSRSVAHCASRRAYVSHAHRPRRTRSLRQPAGSGGDGALGCIFHPLGARRRSRPGTARSVRLHPQRQSGGSSRCHQRIHGANNRALKPRQPAPHCCRPTVTRMARGAAPGAWFTPRRVDGAARAT